jgi:hypothetical protein
MDAKPPIGGPASAKNINGMILNVIIPGLGTIMNGDTGVGVGQLLLVVLGFPTLIFIKWFLGLAMIFGGWTWSIVTGVQMMLADPGQGDG